MKTTAFLGYFCSGLLMTNSTPHIAIAVTGRQNMTPFGRDSSAVTNGIWGGVNVLAGLFLLRATDRKGTLGMQPHTWLLAFLLGGLVWSIVMSIIEFSGYTHRPQE